MSEQLARLNDTHKPVIVLHDKVHPKVENTTQQVIEEVILINPLDNLSR